MLPTRVRRLFRLDARGRNARASEIDDEVAFHIRERIDALIERGWSVEDATAEATRRFGDPAVARVALLAEAQRRDRYLTSIDWADVVRGDLRVAARRLRQAPTFTVGVVVAFALGIGANATMFSVIDRLLLRPPAGIERPERVYSLHASPRDQLSFPAFLTLRDHLSDVASVAVQTSPRPLPVGVGDATHMAPAVFVDGGYFRTLGVTPVAGRLISATDVLLPGGQPVAVISHRMWQQQFDRDPSVVGRDIVVSSNRVRVIGVAPDGFNGVGTRPLDLWLPVTMASALLPGAGAEWPWATADNAWLMGIARVTAGVDQHQVAVRATTLLRAAARVRATRDTSSTIEIESILPRNAESFSVEMKVASLLGGVSLLVLLIACANVMTLLLARAARQRREISLRLALGASRRRLVAGFLADSCVLSTLGGTAAVGVAAVGAALMRGVLLQGFAWNGALVDARTVLFIACAALFTGMLTGIVPAFVSLRALSLPIAIGEDRGSGGAQRHRTISLLIVAQSLLSAVLLIGALLFVQSLDRVHRVPLGIDMSHVVVVSPDARTLRASGGHADALFAELRATMGSVPGVENVSLAEGLPLTQWFLSTRLSVPGQSPVAPTISRGGFIRAVTSGYFAAIGTRIVQGRGFTESDDRETAEQTAIISRRMATALWPGGAIGQCVRLGADSMPCRRIIGIAEDTRESATTDDEPASAYGSVIYVPLSQGRHTVGARVVVGRIAGPPAATMRSIRVALGRANPNVPLADVWNMQSRRDPELMPWKMGATMFGVFGTLALVLAALGLYSVLGYGVAQRTTEIGIRLALGARRATILSLVGMQGIVLTAAGIVAAIFAAFLLTPIVQPLLFQTSGRSPAVYAAVSLVMLVVAIVASLFPAVRATRVDPMSVLRSQ